MNNQFLEGFEKVAFNREEAIAHIQKGNTHSVRNYGTTKDYAQFGIGGAGTGIGAGLSGAITGGVLSKAFTGKAQAKQIAKYLGKMGLIGGAAGLGVAGLRHLAKEKIERGKHLDNISDDNLKKGVKQTDSYYKKEKIRNNTYLSKKLGIE